MRKSELRSYFNIRAIVFVPPRINDWNRFEEWVNGMGELVELLDNANIESLNAEI